MRLKRCISLAVLASSVTSIASANDYGMKFEPYFGADVQYARWGFEDTFGKGHLANSAKQGHVYVGANVHDYLAIEFGYEASVKTEKSSTSLTTGSTVLGAVVIAVQSASKNNFLFRQQAVNLDLVPQFKIPGHEEVTLFGVLGVSRENINAGMYLSDNGDGAGTPTMTQQIRQSNKKILRLGAGLKYQFSDSAGVKVSAVWKKWSDYNNLRGAGETFNAAFNPTLVRMRNGYQLGLGVYAFL